MPIDETYEGHDIHATALQLRHREEWEPRITVSYSEGIYLMITIPDITKSFSNRAEAESHALTFAREWIDQGKPPLD
jgi:hypothetical protein